MSCIIHILTRALQDADDNAYARFVRVYAFFGCESLAVLLIFLAPSFYSPDLGRLQRSHKKILAQGSFIQERLHRFETAMREKDKRISVVCFGCTMLLMRGGWGCLLLGRGYWE
jgi:hypothetical protein